MGTVMSECYVKDKLLKCKEDRWVEYDARAIPLCTVCENCRKDKLSVYRPDVLTDPNYWHDEPLYEEDY